MAESSGQTDLRTGGQDCVDAPPLPLDHNGPVDRPFIRFALADIDGSVPGRFARIAGISPNRPAIVDDGEVRTYAEVLNEMQGIAAAIDRTARPGPVAVLLGHGSRFPVALLGVLAAGRGCVPLDANHPGERNRAIASHAGVAVVVSAGETAAMANRLFSSSVPVIDLDQVSALPSHPFVELRSEDLAFIVYTSGSTGAPKGVWQDHRGVLHDIMECTNTEHLGPDDRLALFFAPTVSSSLRVTLSTLLNGGAVHMLHPNDRESADLAEDVRRQEITVFRAVPALFRHVASALAPGVRLDSVRLVLLGGDRVDWSDVEAARRTCRAGASILVCLGGTETWSLHTQWFVDESISDRQSSLPVGRPMLPDRVVRIVDDRGDPVPDGETGEIVVSSRYLARGYWREPQLTAQSFGVDPADPTRRTFRTGDLARRRSDGLIEFAGRKDQQIKLGGRRVEPGEVEATLRLLRGVADAAVVVRRDAAGVPRAMAAYIELAPDVKGMRPRHVRWGAARLLPEHMVPGAVILCNPLPRLGNMKIDRVRLARVDAERATRTEDRTPLTDAIGQIFEDVVGLAGATPDDNLVSMGGNSLNAVEAMLKIEQRFGIRVPPSRFKATESIRDLSHWIERQRPSGTASRSRTPSHQPAEIEGLNDFGDLQNMRFLPGLDAAGARRCRTELLAAFREGRAPVAIGSLSDWSAALTLLFATGRFDVLRHSARHLAEVYPEFDYPKGLGAFLEQMPEPHPDATNFLDDPAKHVQVVERKSDTVVICFCDALHMLGMPLAAAHRWMGHLPASIIYLRDFGRLYYLNGVGALAANFDGTVAALHSLIASLGARRTLCYGSSAGAFGALRYAAALRADRVLALGGPTNLEPDFNIGLRWANSGQRIAAAISGPTLDLKPFYDRSDAPPALLLCADADWDDRLQMERLADLPSVELRTFPYAGHNVAIELVKQGAYSDLLASLVR